MLLDNEFQHNPSHIDPLFVSILIFVNPEMKIAANVPLRLEETQVQNRSGPCGVFADVWIVVFSIAP